VPITAFFLITGANYYFPASLLNIAIAGVAGLFRQMYCVARGGSAWVCEKRGVTTRKALTIMRAWAGVVRFRRHSAGVDLRPFLGTAINLPGVRTLPGNFYAAVIYAVNKLLHGEEKPDSVPGKQDSIPRLRLHHPADRHGADSTQRRKRPCRGRRQDSRAVARHELLRSRGRCRGICGSLRRRSLQVGAGETDSGGEAGEGVALSGRASSIAGWTSRS